MSLFSLSHVQLNVSVETFGITAMPALLDHSNCRWRWRWLCVRDVVRGTVPHQKQQHRRLLSFESPVSCESAWLADSSCGPGNAATERPTTLYALRETTHRIKCELWWVVSPGSWLVYHTITSFRQNSSWVTQQLFRCGKLQTLDTISETKSTLFDQPWWIQTTGTCYGRSRPR